MVFIYGARNIGEFHAILLYNGGIFFMLGGCNFSSTDIAVESSSNFLLSFFAGFEYSTTRGVERSND